MSRAVPGVRRMRAARRSAVARSCRPCMSTGRAAGVRGSGRSRVTGTRCSAVARSGRPCVSRGRAAGMGSSGGSRVTGTRCRAVARSGRTCVTSGRAAGMARCAGMRLRGSMRLWSGMRRSSMGLGCRFRSAGMRRRSRMGSGRAVLLAQHQGWDRYH